MINSQYIILFPINKFALTPFLCMSITYKAYNRCFIDAREDANLPNYSDVTSSSFYHNDIMQMLAKLHTWMHS